MRAGGHVGTARLRLATKRLRPRRALLLPEHALRVAGTRLVSNFCEVRRAAAHAPLHTRLLLAARRAAPLEHMARRGCCPARAPSRASLLYDADCLRLRRATQFRAEPDGANPDGRTTRQSQEPFEIPTGWRVVRTSDDDWEQVRRRCIGEWTWSTNVVVVGDGDAESGAHDDADETLHWRGFCARDYCSVNDPAREYDHRFNLEPVSGRSGWLRFPDFSYRLLLRREVL